MLDHLLVTAVDTASPPVVFLQRVALVVVVRAVGLGADRDVLPAVVHVVAVEADFRVVVFVSVQVVIRALDSAVVCAACLGAAVVRAAFVQAPAGRAPCFQVDVVQLKCIQHSPRWA